MERDEARTSINDHENKKSTRFKRICVFCGSKAGYSSSFSDAALSLGNQLVLLLNFMCMCVCVCVLPNFIKKIACCMFSIYITYSIFHICVCYK